MLSSHSALTNKMCALPSRLHLLCPWSILKTAKGVMSLHMVTSTRAATLSGRSMTRSSTLILRARRHREFSSLMISCLEKVLSKNFHSFLSTLGIRISSSKSMAMLDCQGHTGQLMDLLSQPQASLKPFTSQSKSLTKSLQSILTTLENLRSSLVAMTFQIYHLHQP